ncbi:hypothetical protein C0Z18_12415 [Trinickia dabaoshanensis]|uniref:DUF4148 domain-containing protein n=1 Tax=Trinickia dabaoshanensis TaxID=564714 RepID=A0A2N7VRN0_9BURK|nr:DUF4148 domain-containing protein [Trinickia dabaoshanensis]PMS19817.1 hypothetical protein C0Z18_12415 [Trinickia dabaoshanensis]TAM50872.1 MAG: DUF4148 domain-containing protein [Paraburkholderia sp.]
MKSTVKSIVLAAVVVAPAISFAQPSNVPLTRAQVRHELTQLERAGYNPARKDNMYPADIQAAEARVAAKSEATGAASTGVGGTPGGASQSGLRVPAADWNSLYSHH